MAHSLSKLGLWSILNYSFYRLVLLVFSDHHEFSSLDVVAAASPEVFYFSQRRFVVRSCLELIVAADFCIRSARLTSINRCNGFSVGSLTSAQISYRLA